MSTSEAEDTKQEPLLRLSQPHDQLFKNLLQTFHHELLQLVDPAIAKQVEESCQFLNQELFPEVGNDTLRRLDVFAEHSFKAGSDEAPLLSNTEIEAEYSSEMPLRVQHYQSLIVGKYLRAAVMLVIFLRGGTAGLSEIISPMRVAGKPLIHFMWYQLGLKMMSADVYVNNENLLYVLLSVHMKRDTMSKAKHRAECLRRIYEAKLSKERQKMAVVFVCTYLHLAAHEQEEYNQLMAAQQQQYKGATTMELTWEEQMVERGKKEGEEKGRIASLLRILGRRNIALADAQRAKIQSCRDLSQLDHWIDRAIEIQAADELWA